MAYTAVPRLSDRTLAQVRPGTAIPGYDREKLGVGIVHLGLGAFVRAHLATYMDDVLAQSFGAWGIAGVSLQRADQRDKLAPQDGLYTALSRDGETIMPRIIGCIRALLVAPEAPAAVLEVMAEPATRIVSLTITEKGYCHDPATGRLDQDHPDIQHDLSHPSAPRSAVGLIVQALARRHAADVAPFTTLCCDNLPHNGRLLAGLVRDFAALRDDRLANWIESSTAFPSTMVDRIVPAATEADVAAATEATGLFDAAAVSHEPFRQWVIEDRFVDDVRPAWQEAGAELVNDVAPYETMKLRMLNGAHSALAYLGYLAGYDTICETVSDPVFRGFVAELWAQEIGPVLSPPPGIDAQHYAAQLLARFVNPAIRHRTWQIAMDGSQKLPQRLLSTIRDRLGRGLPIPRLALVVAAWIVYVGGIDERGQPIDVRDPYAAKLRALLEDAGPSPKERIRAMIGAEDIFSTDLSQSSGFMGAVTDAYSRLVAQGARYAAASLF